VGAALAQASQATVLSAQPVGKGHNQKNTSRDREVRDEDGNLRRSELPPGPAHGIPSARQEKPSMAWKATGMLASASELGIGRDRDGILELAGALNLLPDHIIEVDNKS